MLALLGLAFCASVFLVVAIKVFILIVLTIFVTVLELFLAIFVVKIALAVEELLLGEPLAL